MMRDPRLLIPLALFATAACSTYTSDLPKGQAAYDLLPAPVSGSEREDYRIVPSDVLAVNVFQEPELSPKDLVVDASGQISFPLIGQVRAGGKTTRELAVELTKRLGERYLVNPQISVLVTSSSSQRVVVEGSVTQPGVYEITGSTTLIEALALAKSPTRVARLDQVAVFREVGGKRMGALFDVNKIRSGAAPDPEIHGGDTVVVGFSGIKGGFRDFLTTAPILNLFRPF